MFFRCVRFLSLRLAVLVGAFVLAGATAGYSADPLSKPETFDLPVHFSATSLSHDDENQTVTAIGNVELVQGKQILRADKVVYYLAEDKVTALGNVSLLDERGNVHFIEYAELRNHMKEGFVQGLLSLLADGSRFTATTARREDNGTKTSMTDATYTICKVCEADPHPLWQIKADSVSHDTKDKTIRYKNARMEVLGVPIAYSPVFWHPDPTLKRKSGFLRPEYGWSQDLGTHIEAGYYYTLSPDKDLTLRVEPTTKAGTVFKGQWRQRFEHGQIQFDGTTVNSDRKEEDGSISEGKQRGSLFATGLFDLDDKWRTGFDLQRASDKQYLGFYDLIDRNFMNGIKANSVLTSQVYAERFAGRDYSRITGYSFQDLRLGDRPEQADVLPMVEHTMLGEPNALWGGRWGLGASAVELLRNPDDQNVQRVSLDGNWQRHGTTDLGFSNTVALDTRGDFYSVQNNQAALIDPTVKTNPSTFRGMATASAVSSYPLVKTLASSQLIVEPMVGVNVSPQVDSTNDVIPDEDSIDIQFDANNLFEANRFPGLDRQEDGGRVNYGVKTGIYADDGKFGQIFLGESYRFYGEDIFPVGSGLENHRSDVIGQIKVGLSKYLEGDYRFQFDSETLRAKRHEIQASGGNDVLRLNTRYLYTAPILGTGFEEARQQIQSDATYKFTKTWKWFGAGLVDLGDQPGFRNGTTGIEYADECFTFGILGSRNVADAASGEDETKITMRIGFTGIGEFTGPKIGTGRSSPRQQ